MEHMLLRTAAEIAGAINKPERRIPELVKNHGLPAIKDDGAWQMVREDAVKWTYERIRAVLDKQRREGM